MTSDRDIVVRLDTISGLSLLPEAADIIGLDYTRFLIGVLKEDSSRWVGIISEVLSRKTPVQWIEKRQGPHGMTLFYVDGTYAKVTRQAIARIGIASDIEVLQTDVTPEEVNCLVRLTFKYKGETVSATQWGVCMRRSGVALGYTKKGAVTDGEKKTLNEFGWAMDVYTSEGQVAEPPNPEEMKAAAVNGLYDIGNRGGMSRLEVDAFVGINPAELKSADLTAWKRKLERKVREDMDKKTRTVKR